MLSVPQELQRHSQRDPVSLTCSDCRKHRGSIEGEEVDAFAAICSPHVRSQVAGVMCECYSRQMRWCYTTLGKGDYANIRLPLIGIYLQSCSPQTMQAHVQIVNFRAVQETPREMVRFVCGRLQGATRFVGFVRVSKLEWRLYRPEVAAASGRAQLARARKVCPATTRAA